MSIPVNHHYVSKCHIKNFLNQEGNIFLFDKLKNHFHSARSTKHIFSEKYSNSIYRDGQVNHLLLEQDLKSFEDNFPAFVELIADTRNKKMISQECYQALIEVTLFGIAGNLRFPAAKKELDDIYSILQTNLSDHMTDKLKREFEQSIEFKKHVKYSNLLSYRDTALRIYGKMGGLDFTIWHIQSDDCFLLLDTTAFTIRRKINNYFNPNIEEIAEVGIPLTNKLFVHAISKKLGQKKSYITFIKKNHDQSVVNVNYNLFHFSRNTVATSDENYLRHIVTIVKD